MYSKENSHERARTNDNIRKDNANNEIYGPPEMIYHSSESTTLTQSPSQSYIPTGDQVPRIKVSTCLN